MSQISIIKYKNEYKQDLIKFLAFFYNSLDYEERKRLFEWRYENNPYTKYPYIYLAFDKEEIVGFRAFVIQKFTLKDKEFLLGTPADAVVHPQYRRKGIFSKLTEFALSDMYQNSNVRFLVSLSANDASEAGNVKLGFVPIGRRKYMFLVSTLNALKTSFRDNVFQNKYSVSLKEDIKIEISKELRSKEISKLMNKFLDKNKIRNVKDVVFYEWAWGSSPYEYTYAYCTRKNELVGYICLEKKSSFLYSLIEYGYTEPKFLHQLIKTTSKKLSIPLLRLYIFTKNQNEISMFNNYGFQGENNISMKLFKKINLLKIDDGAGMLIKPISEDTKNEDFMIDNEDTRLSHNWYLFPSDSH
ncbi:MAG: GNAT family N-acetyltransferase [Methanobacterium sp.]